MRPNVPTDVATLSRTTREALQRLALAAGSPGHVDVQAAVSQLLERHRQGPLRWAFYMIVDMANGELSWQQGLDQALGAPSKGVTIQEFFQQIHPDYVVRYLAWGLGVHEAYFQHPEVAATGPVYHITIPLRHADGRYFWYTQRSVVLQTDAQGQLLSYFNLYDYAGPWHVHYRRPLVPFITTTQQPDRLLEAALFKLMGRQIYDQFTLIERCILEEYVPLPAPAKPWTGTLHVRHEHHVNILRKARALFCCEFANARVFAGFVAEAGLWPTRP